MLRRPGILALAAAVLTVSSPRAAAPQSRWISGYIQTVPLFSVSPVLAEAGASDFSRIRLTTQPSAGPFAVEVAYEHALTFRQSAETQTFGVAGLTGVPGGGEWFDLGGTLSRASDRHVTWQHRFDRLNVSFSPTDSLELRIGRQAISWGTTLFLTPADPFTPFSPTDPFRVFRGGVDAVRLRIYPGPLSEIDLVFRPTRTAVGEEVTLLARGLATWLNWEVSGWGGRLYGDAAGAVGLAGSMGPWAVRAEAVVRDYDGTLVARGTIGVDRTWQAAGRDMGIVAEYQRDGRGAAAPEGFESIFRSDELLRGEYQVFGRDELMMTLTYQVHPLWSLSGLTLVNLNDRSVIVAPGFAYSASDNTSLAGGVYLGQGDRDAPEGQLLASEYGPVGVAGYLSWTWFF